MGWGEYIATPSLLFRLLQDSLFPSSRVKLALARHEIRVTTEYVTVQSN